MFRFIFYIVFLFSCFNFETANAETKSEAKIIYAPIDANEGVKTLNLPEASNLPHPLQMKELIENSSDSFAGKIILLGRYFDARYPGDQIDADFHEDVALIFPDVSSEEIDNITVFLRLGVKTYRFTQDKISEFKEKSILPKDPPLTATDDEYAILGDQDYIKAPDGEFALVTDFKKIIGYGNNRREREAMEEFLKRRFQTDDAQTDFEHFQEMMQKIEWNKIFQYGVSLPSPFVGNAGIGKYTSQDDFKVRLLSEEGRLGDQTEILAALHVRVPTHRFMLATPLDETHFKPEIKLQNIQNIDSYEVFYPMPLSAVSEKMIGAYRGDFAFPIKLKLKDSHTPVSFDAVLTFENCDAELQCTHEEITSSLKVGVDNSKRSTPSSVKNFVTQSYYNLPKAENKHIELKEVSYSEQNDITLLNFDFAYTAKIKNLAFLLENRQHTIFSDPEMIVADGHIYLNTHTIQNGENVQKEPLTILLRLNDYDVLQKTIIPAQYQNQPKASSLFKMFLLGVWIGCCFYFTFFGFPLLMELFLLRREKTFLRRYGISKVLTFGLTIIGFAIFSFYHPDIFYFESATHPFYVSLMFFILMAKYMGIHLNIKKNHLKPAFYGFLSALLILFACPLAPFIGTPAFIQNLQTSDFFVYIIEYTGLFIGFILPDILLLNFKQKDFHEKWNELALLLFKTFIVTDLVILFLWIVIPLTFFSIVKILFFLFISYLILQFLFYFWQALFQTRLKKSYISGTQNILIVLIFLCIFLMSKSLSYIGTPRLLETQNISFLEIQNRVMKGENILLALCQKNSIKCLYNNITFFNSYYLERLKTSYGVTYLPVVSSEISLDTLELLKKYRRFERPLYVLFSPITPNGVALESIILPSKLFSSLSSFHLERF